MWEQLRSRAEKQAAHEVGSVPLELRHDVAVGVGGHVDLGVTEDLHRDAQLHALQEHERGGGVAAVVEAKWR